MPEDELVRLNAKLKTFSKLNDELKNQLDEAEIILNLYNKFLKEEFSWARILGTAIDDYFKKYLP